MTAQAEVYTAPLSRIPRDRQKRPLVVPPGGTRPVPYTRTTKFVEALDDSYNLDRWHQRMVAAGLAVRPDLVLQAASLGPEPAKLILSADGVTYTPNPLHPEWRDDMSAICDAAQQAAKANAKANIGTSLHKLCERMDNGEDTGIVPVDYLPHLGAYAHITDGWEWLAIERFMVCDPLKIGGTPDRIARVPGLEKPVIADIKTGDVVYSQNTISMQLAVYAHSVYYVHDTATRMDPPPDLDKELGLVISLDATTGKAEILEVDLVAGWEAVHLTTKVKKWRAKRGLLKPRQETTRPPAPKPTGSMAEAESALADSLKRKPRAPVVREVRAMEPVDFLLQAIRSAPTPAHLTQLWRDNKGAWTPTLTEAAASRKTELEGGR